MQTLRKSLDRGHADHGWLKSLHSFSFAGYYDPEHMGWGNLRVINEDRINAGTGFGRHGHRDMEIISYVLSGELEHRDSLGNTALIPPGDIQRMTAGSGVQHSEMNHAQDSETHFFQIWIEPDHAGIEPGYAQSTIPAESKRGALSLIAAPDGTGHAIRLNANARLYAGLFDGTERAELTLAVGRKAYVHLVRGTLEVNGTALEAGDALKISDETLITLSQGNAAEVLVFDLTA